MGGASLNASLNGGGRGTLGIDPTAAGERGRTSSLFTTPLQGSVVVVEP